MNRYTGKTRESPGSYFTAINDQVVTQRPTTSSGSLYTAIMWTDKLEYDISKHHEGRLSLSSNDQTGPNAA